LTLTNLPAIFRLVSGAFVLIGEGCACPRGKPIAVKIRNAGVALAWSNRSYTIPERNACHVLGLGL
jgi:hypothetical protein